MRAKNISRIAVFITIALALVGLPVFAQVETSPGVARVSLIKGDVTTERGDSAEWVVATVNTPVVPGDTIATAARSRAEVQLDYANVLRLDENAEVKIADLTRSRIQLQVARGTVDLVVFKGSQVDSEVDTPNVAIQPLREGTYRIDVNSGDLSLVTVRDGEAQVSTPQGSTTVKKGDQITVEGTQNPEYQVASAHPRDDWDNWNNDRNHVIERAANYNHVNRYYTGAQDLDAYGHWVYVPNYDWCWTPYVNAGWVPYSSGRWVWEPYYGWTWVSYEPWGWAPYHYGRWFFYAGNWCWWPGYVTPAYYPVWGPAYVSFIGFGYGYRHFSFGFGFGFNSIGWCPLGPRDAFYPWWGRGRSFNVVNITNITNITNINGRGISRGGSGFVGSNLEAAMTNIHVRRAITMMPADRFGQEAVLRNHQPVSAEMLRQADVVRGTLPVVPTRASLTAANHAAVVPAAAGNNTNNVRFFTRHPVTSPNQIHSFNSQAASIRQMVETHNPRAVSASPGNPNSGATRAFQAPGSNGVRGNARVFTASSPQTVGGTANTTETLARTEGHSAAQGNQQGWTRFSVQNGQAEANPGGGQQRSLPAAVNQQNTRNERAPAAGWRRFGSGVSGAAAPATTVREGTFNVNRAAPQSRENITPRSAPNAQPDQSGWRRFSGNAPASSPQNTGGGSQRFSPSATPSGQSRENEGGNFRRFTPQSAPQLAPRNGGQAYRFSRPVTQSDNGDRAGWNRFTPRSEATPQSRSTGFYGGASRERGNDSPRYESRPNYGSRYYSRPPLQLNKPIVTERRSQSYEAPRGRSGSGNRGASRNSSSSSSHLSSGGHNRR